MYLNTADKAKEFLASTTEFKVNNEYDKWNVSAGVIGVWASNFLAWKKFLESDYDTLFIFEDDIILSKNFKGITEKYMQELPEDWEFFSLFVADDSLFAYKDEVHNIGQHNVCRSYQQWSCAGYAVSKRGAEKALQDLRTQGATVPVDWYVFNYRWEDVRGQEKNKIEFKTYGIKPIAYRPVKFLLEAASKSQIHWGNTELL